MSNEAYKAAGVDVNAGYEATRLMKEHVARTAIPGVLSGLGGFGGLFAPDFGGYSEPVLVSGTDGVGTKLKLAFILDKHDTVGIDCVAMCVNDVLCCGGKPLFFLDYIATGRLLPEKAAQIVAGVAEGCVQAGCALIGGETAEMPGFYPEGEYDLAGFTVGIVDKPKILDGSTAKAGDALIALPSSGVHSNGFSLVRRAFGLTDSSPAGQALACARLATDCPDCGCTLGEALLAPTRIYVKPVLALLEKVAVCSMAHITGGGFFENIPRALPKNLCARIAYKDVRTPPLFARIARAVGVPQKELFGTFNMGVGMVLVVPAESADAALACLREQGEDAYVLGELVEGGEGVVLC